MNKLIRCFKRLMMIILAISLLSAISVFAYNKYYEIKHGYTSNHWYNSEYGTSTIDGNFRLIRRTDDYILYATFGDDGKKLIIDVGWFTDECIVGGEAETDGKYTSGTPKTLHCQYGKKSHEYFLTYGIAWVLDRPYQVFRDNSENIGGYHYSLSYYRLNDFAEIKKRYDTLGRMK